MRCSDNPIGRTEPGTHARNHPRQYFKFLDEKGGFFYERWGDGAQLEPYSRTGAVDC